MASPRRLRRSCWNRMSRHWYILADQNVRKLDANSYATSMTGLKYKLAHKRVGIKGWNSTESAQREQLIKILEEYVAQLK